MCAFAIHSRPGCFYDIVSTTVSSAMLHAVSFRISSKVCMTFCVLVLNFSIYIQNLLKYWSIVAVPVYAITSRMLRRFLAQPNNTPHIPIEYVLNVTYYCKNNMRSSHMSV